MAKRKFCEIAYMLLNFIKLAGWQLSGVAIGWMKIFPGGNFLGGNFPGGSYPGWEFSGWELSVWELLAFSVKHFNKYVCFYVFMSSKLFNFFQEHVQHQNC